MIPLLNLFITQSPKLLPFGISPGAQGAPLIAEQSFADFFSQLDKTAKADGFPGNPAAAPLSSVPIEKVDDVDLPPTDQIVAVYAPHLVDPVATLPQNPLDTTPIVHSSGDADSIASALPEKTLSPDQMALPANLPAPGSEAAPAPAPKVRTLVEPEMASDILDFASVKEVSYPLQLRSPHRSDLKAALPAPTQRRGAEAPQLHNSLHVPISQDLPADLGLPARIQADVHETPLQATLFDSTRSPAVHPIVESETQPQRGLGQPHPVPVPLVPMPKSSSITVTPLPGPSSAVEAAFRGFVLAQPPAPASSLAEAPSTTARTKLTVEAVTPVGADADNSQDSSSGPVLALRPAELDAGQRATADDVSLPFPPVLNPPLSGMMALLGFKPPVLPLSGIQTPTFGPPDDNAEKLIRIEKSGDSDPQGAAMPSPEDHPLFHQAPFGDSSDVMPVVHQTPRDLPATTMTAQQPLQPMPATAQGPLSATLTTMAQEGASDRIEVTLAPEELGKLRISMVADGDVMRVHLVVERPDTLDLLRRHADQMIAEFRQAGYSGASLSFGNWGGEGGSETPHTPLPQQHSTGLAPPKDMSSPLATLATGGLDLRL